MKHKSIINLNSRGGANSQAHRNNEVSPWDSALSRRAFLKKTGAASVATVVVFQGLRVDSLAQTTGGSENTREKRTIAASADGHNLVGSGVAQQSKNSAIRTLMALYFADGTDPKQEKKLPAPLVAADEYRFYIGGVLQADGGLINLGKTPGGDWKCEGIKAGTMKWTYKKPQ